MDIMELKQIIKDCGVAGAGGAGFPSYAKLDSKTDEIILNGAECEPLLSVDKQLLKKYPYEIISTFDLVAKVVGAKKAIISIKSEYVDTIEAVQAELEYFPNVSIKLLQNVYPTGDELVLIYDTLGKVVAPGSFPIDIGVAVFNVETMYNIYKAINFREGVSRKYLSIVGEVANPITIGVPIGMTVKEVVDLAGGQTLDDPAYIMGGPMTGKIVGPYEVIKKTSNAVLVLPKDHYLVRKQQANIAYELKKASSTCCTCEMCTNLCPRNLLGHPITPHTFMRNASSGITYNTEPYINTLYCSSCGICEMYACPQSLSPRKLISKYKDELKKNGVPTPKIDSKRVDANREYRKVPMKRLISRLDLEQYNISAELVDFIPEVKRTKVDLNQSLGVSPKPVVNKGDIVEQGQMIGKADDEKLSLPVHSPISGKVLEVNDKSIMIQSI
ncbi:MAG: NADH-quinone oxidoreductase subunit J [Clostridiales bacterium]|nr:NADH-quinone oxidoreductase subunit J [Clostridiales bacterium]